MSRRKWFEFVSKFLHKDMNAVAKMSIEKFIAWLHFSHFNLAAFEAAYAFISKRYESWYFHDGSTDSTRFHNSFFAQLYFWNSVRDQILCRFFLFFFCFRMNSCILKINISFRISIDFFQKFNNILKVNKLAYADYVKTFVDKLDMLDLTHHVIL